MTGQLDLRDNLHKPSIGISDKILDLLLCVEVGSIGRAVTLRAHCAHLREARILLDLDAPSLILCQVEVELIDLEHGEDINRLLHVIYRLEVTTRIHMLTTIAKLRIVLDTDIGYGPALSTDLRGALYLSREELQERLHTPEGTARSGGLDQDTTVRGNVERVPLLVRDHLVSHDDEADLLGGVAARRLHGQIVSGRACDLVPEEVSDNGKALVCDNLSRRGQCPATLLLAYIHFYRLRNDVYPLIIGSLIERLFHTISTTGKEKHAGKSHDYMLDEFH